LGSNSRKRPDKGIFDLQNKILEGLPVPFAQVGEISKRFFVSVGRWIYAHKDRPLLIAGQISRSQLDSILLLPSDPEFFKNVKILIGDKPPEISTTS